MSRYVILSPDADADIESAVRWYQRKEINLGFRFKAEIEAILRRIARYPYEFPLVNNKVRRAVLVHFPYSIYFKFDADSVLVIAVLHQRRSDKLWTV